MDDVRWADEQPEIAGVWFIDHVQGWLPRGVESGLIGDPHALIDPFSLMAAAAAQTTRVTLGVAVTDPLRRSPLALAHGALSIGHLGGRPMSLGLGSGVAENLDDYGLRRGGQVAYMEAACREILTLRTPYEGKTLARADDVSPALALANRATMRLYVAAHGPRMIDVAARYGDGWLPAGFPPRAYGRRLAALRERAEANGRDPAEIKPLLFVWAALAETKAESDAMLEAPLIRAVALYRDEAAFARHGAVHPLAAHGHGHYMPGRLSRDEALALYDDVPPPVLRDSVLTGSLEEIEEQLGEYEAAGCEHIIVWDIGRFLDPEGTARSRALLQRIARGRAGTIG